MEIQNTGKMLVAFKLIYLFIDRPIKVHWGVKNPEFWKKKKNWEIALTVFKFTLKLNSQQCTEVCSWWKRSGPLSSNSDKVASHPEGKEGLS